MASYIALLRKDKNSDYGVEFPDLPGCISTGSTLEEARRMAEEALAAHVAFLRDDGDEVPAPSTLDVIAKRPEIKGAVPFMVELKELSDRAIRINITVPERVLNLIDEAAAPMGGNRSAFMVSAAEEKARMLTQRNQEQSRARSITHPARNNPPRVAMTRKTSSYEIARTAGGPLLSKHALKKV